MIETEYKNLLLEKLIKIKEVVIEETENNDRLQQTGALSGVSGIALFLFYYARLKNDNLQAEIALTVLSKSFKQINKGNLYQTYCSGLSGFGWTINHLNQEGFIEIDDSLLIDTDEYLYKTMQSYLNEGNYDFLHGAIGCGFYFFKRYKSTSSKQLKSQYKTYLLHLIELLEDLSEKDNKGLKWLSVIDIKTGEKGYNLSLSHGISSIVIFLSHLHHYEDFKDKVEEILKGGINYILSFKTKNQNSFSLFPNYIKLKENVQWNSRVAWCYGDLGIGLTLWKAAKVLKNDKLEKEAIDILINTSKRRLPEKSMVMDAGLCHGSFGNAQIFNYMYSQTKIKEFKNAAEFWVIDGLKKANHKDGYAGFKMWALEGWKNELSVLEGIAGIGLAIISYLSKEDLNWDECLMIS